MVGTSRAAQSPVGRSRCTVRLTDYEYWMLRRLAALLRTSYSGAIGYAIHEALVRVEKRLGIDREEEEE